VNSILIYRASFYVVLTVATTILCGDATDSRLDWFLPWGVGGAGILAFFTVDQSGRWGLPRDLANILAVGTLGLLFLEYRSDETQVIRCLGHWMIYLQLIKYFLPKTSEDDWFLFLLGLTQVLIGSVINQSDIVGAWLWVWAMLAVWVLGLFFLQREIRRFRIETETGAVSGQTAPDPYHGLFDVPYFGTTLRALALTLVLGGLVFLLLPRQIGATRPRISGTMAKHLTGFDDEVKLGQLGEILENDSIVMSVEFADENRIPTHPPGEPLFRGVTLSQYEKGRWRRQIQRSIQTIVSLPFFRNSGPRKRAVIRQIIKLEPNDSPTLFAMRPILELSAASRLAPCLNPLDGTIFRPDSRGGYDYEVLSDANPQAPQVDEKPLEADRTQMLLAMPESLRARFREIALPLVKHLPVEGIEAVSARARALESHLRDSREYGYTLEMNVVDPQLDPVEDFLVKRKKGHCEYFASAVALLLRSIDIPARLVNGFKGGDWNNLTQSMNVRQKHAHSWVEAYVGEDPSGSPLWITLDATPVSDRDESVAQVGGVSTNIRPFADMIRYVWVFYILGYDASRQNRLLYAPIKVTIREVRRGYAMLWYWTKRGFAYLFSFQSLGAFISIKGFLVSFIVLSLLVLIVKLAISVVKRLLDWWRGPTDDSAGLTAGILFYRRLVQLLADYDLERTPAETQNEFALRASRFLTGQPAQIQAVAEVPQKIVEAFYRVRFGHRELDPDTLKQLEENLDLLQTRLNTNPDQ
jgi:protein-glutamine gamma-glutamyltransferase